MSADTCIAGRRPTLHLYSRKLSPRYERGEDANCRPGTATHKTCCCFGTCRAIPRRARERSVGHDCQSACTKEENPWKHPRPESGEVAGSEALLTFCGSVSISDDSCLLAFAFGRYAYSATTHLAAPQLC